MATDALRIDLIRWLDGIKLSRDLVEASIPADPSLLRRGEYGILDLVVREAGELLEKHDIHAGPLDNG